MKSPTLFVLPTRFVLPTHFVLGAALTAAATQAQAQEMTSPATNPPMAPATEQPAVPSPTVAPKAGDPVYDNTGVVAGSVDSVADQKIVLSTEKGKATIPVTSLAMGSKGLMINLSKSQLDSAVAAARGEKRAN